VRIDNKLYTWYQEHKRDLPWRQTSNPYFIWLSEIILQQTRVAQGQAYYLKFKTTYPTVKDLANASLDSVLKLWEGLGYYSRARNLHAGAKQIMNDFNGEFPSTYKDILSIRGIGPYTAAAIASFCFGEERAVLDGNVFRVLARLHGITTPINSTVGKKQFQELADAAIHQVEDPGTFNQAIMEFGALQCTPKNPDCANCPFQENCIAFNTGTVQKLPVKIKAKPPRHRYFHYLIVLEDDDIYIQQRKPGDIWSHLYELPLIETDKPVNQPKALRKILGVEAKLNRMAGPIVHVLSHQRLHLNFWHAEVLPDTLNNGMNKVALNHLKDLAFPIAIKRFVDTNLLPLPPRLK
jgi:A/G-specific adenine glycosylase